MHTCAEYEEVVLVGPRHGTGHAALGADDVRDVTSRLRAVWPDGRITGRGDCGLRSSMMSDERREVNLQFKFGLGINECLKTEGNELLATVEVWIEET